MYPEPPELPWQAALKYRQQVSNLWDSFRLRLIQMLWSLYRNRPQADDLSI